MGERTAGGGALLAAHAASFGYGDKVVVRDVELEVRAGDFVGIVGPNGAGKTTLFRGLLGLIRPFAGRVERGPVAIGYVPQRESLDPIYPLRVDEVVHMGAYGELRGLRRLSRDARERARTHLERVGLLERAGDPFSSLSGGQRQRALIARALMVEPRVLLLDEPTSGVDRLAQERILELLTDLNQREGLAVLLVSHQIGLVRASVRDALWVADGRVLRGPTEELLDPTRLDALYAGAARGPGG